MLTQKQKQFLAKISEDASAVITPWDPKAAAYARELVRKLERLDLEVFWEGSLALEIAGENDIDLYIFSAPQDFSLYLPGIRHILGEPTYTLPDKLLWRINKDGHKIDATLTDKKSSEVILDMLFYNKLKNNPELLKQYADLKTPGISAKEYYIRKNEFYNKITGNK